MDSSSAGVRPFLRMTGSCRGGMAARYVPCVVGSLPAALHAVSNSVPEQQYTDEIKRLREWHKTQTMRQDASSCSRSQLSTCMTRTWSGLLHAGWWLDRYSKSVNNDIYLLSTVICMDTMCKNRCMDTMCKNRCSVELNKNH